MLAVLGKHHSLVGIKMWDRDANGVLCILLCSPVLGFITMCGPHRLDLAQPEPEATLFRRIELEGLNPDDFETTQRFVSSRDGARIPMFIVQRKGTPRDGNNPTLLYGYGGLFVPYQPAHGISNPTVWPSP